MMDQRNPSSDEINNRIRRAAGRRKNDWIQRRFGRSTDQLSFSLKRQDGIDYNTDQEPAESINPDWMRRQFGRSIPAQFVDGNRGGLLETNLYLSSHTRERREAGSGKNTWVNRRFGRSTSAHL